MPEMQVGVLGREGWEASDGGMIAETYTEFIQKVFKKAKELTPAWITLKCPACGAEAYIAGAVNGKRVEYQHEKDGSHAVVIRRIN